MSAYPGKFVVGVEVSPVTEEGDEVVVTVPEEAMYWTVYQRLEESPTFYPAYAYSDHGTRAEAIAAAVELAQFAEVPVTYIDARVRREIWVE